MAGTGNIELWKDCGALRAGPFKPARPHPSSSSASRSSKIGLQTHWNQLNGGTSGNASYNILLNTAAFGGGTSTSMTVGGGNLVNGGLYEIQIWYVEERTIGTPAVNTRVMTYGDGQGNTVNLGGTPGLLGQYAIGTFTADGPNQTLTLATNGFAQSHLTAYQIRMIPEPSVALLSSLSALALFRRRR